MVTRLSTSYIRQSYQLLIELSSERYDFQQAFEVASLIIYEWGKSKFNNIFSLPVQLQTINLSKNGNEFGIIYNRDEGRFIFRVVHPDNKIAGRFWTTDVQVNRTSNKSILATRLSVTSLKNCSENVPLSTPVFIKEIVSRIGLKDSNIIQINGRSHLLSSIEDVDCFISFLETPERFMPVVLITPCENSCDKFPIDADMMSKDLMGIAHVFTITPEANDYFIKQVGTLWAAYNGAIRTYYPHLSFAESDYYQHPLMTQKRMKLQNIQGNVGSVLSETETNTLLLSMRQIEARIKKYTVVSIINWEDSDIKFYLKEYQNILRRKQSEYSEKSRQELIATYQEQITQLEKQCDELAACSDSYADDCKKAQAENDELHQTIYDLNTQILRLRIALQAKTGQKDGEEVPLNGSYAEMKDWVRKYYPDRLRLLPRAERSLKNACYEDIELVYKSLKLLATSYYRYCIGEIDYKTFTQDCNNVDPGLSEAPAITKVAAGMQGDTYVVQYHGKNHRLERHLRKGSNHDRKYCLRIYFFWDDIDRVVVIGDMPHHLDTSAT